MNKPTIITYPVPVGAPTNADFEATANDHPLGVFANTRHSFASYATDADTVTIRVTCSSPISGAQIRPRAANIIPKIDGREITFSLQTYQKISLEIENGPNLFLFADPLEAPPPDPNDPNVVFYGPGYYDLAKETLALHTGQTLYLAGGAYLDNGQALLIDQAQDVTVCGRGIIVAPTRVYRSRRIAFQDITIAKSGLRRSTKPRTNTALKRPSQKAPSCDSSSMQRLT